jgi:hypothetical protein
VAPYYHACHPIIVDYLVPDAILVVMRDSDLAVIAFSSHLILIVNGLNAINLTKASVMQMCDKEDHLGATKDGEMVFQVDTRGSSLV